MSLHEPTEPKAAASEPRRGPLHWLIESKRSLLPVTGLWILALDWLLFSSNALLLGLATPVAMVVGFVVGGTGTLYFQRRFAGDSVLKATWKALVAGCLVGAPWPLAGTLFGGWVLLASGIRDTKG